MTTLWYKFNIPNQIVYLYEEKNGGALHKKVIIIEMIAISLPMALFRHSYTCQLILKKNIKSKIVRPFSIFEVIKYLLVKVKDLIRKFKDKTNLNFKSTFFFFFNRIIGYCVVNSISWVKFYYIKHTKVLFYDFSANKYIWIYKPESKEWII